jgi:hypothetical protein
MTYRQAAAEVRRLTIEEFGADIFELKVPGDESIRALGRLLALLESEDPVPVSRKTLERLEYVHAPHGLVMNKPRCPLCWCSPKDLGGDGHDEECELAALLNKERSP